MMHTKYLIFSLKIPRSTELSASLAWDYRKEGLPLQARLRPLLLRHPRRFGLTQSSKREGYWGVHLPLQLSSALGGFQVHDFHRDSLLDLDGLPLHHWSRRHIRHSKLIACWCSVEPLPVFGKSVNRVIKPSYFGSDGWLLDLVLNALKTSVST
jgi:hypothetical protein